MSRRTNFFASAIVGVVSALSLSICDPAAALTWESYQMRRAPPDNDTAKQGGNNWTVSGNSLHFSQTGAQSYVADFMQTTDSFTAEGIRIEFDMKTSLNTQYGYVGPWILLSANSGSTGIGWNGCNCIGPHVWYNWETKAKSGAVLHLGSSTAAIITNAQVIAGTNDGSFAHHVFSISNGTVTWQVNGATVMTGKTTTTGLPAMRLAIGARLYDSGVNQTIDIQNLTVSTASPPSNPKMTGYSGPLSGTFSGSIQTPSGTTQTTGAVSGTYQTVFSGGIPASVVANGTIAVGGDTALGITFTTNYDIATNAFTGSYNDGTGSKAITFSPINDTTWQLSISGQRPTSNGLGSYSITGSFQIPEDAYRQGRDMQKMAFTGPISMTQAVSIPISVPSIGYNQTANINIVVSGNWNARFVPAAGGKWSIVGDASGSFQGDKPITINGSYTPAPGVPAVQITKSFSIAGSFSGTLFGNFQSNSVTFEGSWNETGSGTGTNGGQIKLAVPLDLSTHQAPTILPSFSGSVPVSVSVAAPVPVPPVNFNVPINVSGGSAPLTVNRK